MSGAYEAACEAHVAHVGQGDGARPQRARRSGLVLALQIAQLYGRLLTSIALFPAASRAPAHQDMRS